MFGLPTEQQIYGGLATALQHRFTFSQEDCLKISENLLTKRTLTIQISSSNNLIFYHFPPYTQPLIRFNKSLTDQILEHCSNQTLRASYSPYSKNLGICEETVGYYGIRHSLHPPCADGKAGTQVKRRLPKELSASGHRAEPGSYDHPRETKQQKSAIYQSVREGCRTIRGSETALMLQKADRPETCQLSLISADTRPSEVRPSWQGVFCDCHTSSRRGSGRYCPRWDRSSSSPDAGSGVDSPCAGGGVHSLRYRIA